MKVIQSSVVRALVAIVVGVMLILYRKATLEWMVIITGALFFLSGCLSCLAYYWGRRKAGSNNIVVFLTICISYANNCFTL